MDTSVSAIDGWRTVGRTQEARLVGWVLVAFLAWMPLQTPIALVAWQYLHASVQVAQAILLLKDVWAAAFFLVLLIRHWRDVRFFWFDWFALAFAVLVAVYSIVPAALGSHLPAASVIASARELLVPVELYGLGRLAGYAGVSTKFLVAAFLVIAGITAVGTVGSLALVGQQFWSTSYNIVGFIHDVQGITSATTIWWASILANYGRDGWAVRAIGPFTHPVGTGVYFAMPLVMVVCAAWMTDRHRRKQVLIAALVVALFGLAVITPISRGTWFGFLGAAAVCGVILHKFRLAALTMVIFVAFIAIVPPFNATILSLIDRTDDSAAGHVSALQNAVNVITAQPGGSGVGQGDQYGQALSGGEAAGVGENMYLTTYASTGPVGFIAFVVWFCAILFELMRRFRANLPEWIAVGVGAGLLAEGIAGMTASTLMRFTTAASIWVVVGLLIAVPIAGSRPVDLDGLRHPRRWLQSKRPKATSEPALG